MILVLGATGLLGTEICQLLAESGKPFRALVRTTSAADQVEALRAMGAEIATGDLKDRNSLDAACRGITTVISTASALLSSQAEDSIEAVDKTGHFDLIEAAKAAGASRFVYVSHSVSLDQASPLTTAKRAVERALEASGLTFTILRPTLFTEVWLSPRLGFDFEGSRATIYGSGQRPISFHIGSGCGQVRGRILEQSGRAKRHVRGGWPGAVKPTRGSRNLRKPELARLHNRARLG